MTIWKRQSYVEEEEISGCQRGEGLVTEGWHERFWGFGFVFLSDETVLYLEYGGIW